MATEAPLKPASTAPAPAGGAAGRTPAGPVVPHRPTLLQRVAARLIYWVIRGVSLTLRYRWERDPALLPSAGRPYIFGVWHNRLALSIVLYRQYVRAVGERPRMAGLVSASRDGALLSRVLELLDVQPVRGSSSRRGAQALLELSSWLDKGYDVAITVDGPRGPRYGVKPGVIGLAQLTGRMIVPASFRLSRKWTLKSWDRFQIPVPFATCTIDFGEPLRVPRELTDDERERVRQDLEGRLKALTRDD